MAAPRFPAPEGSLADSYAKQVQAENACVDTLTSYRVNQVSVFDTGAEELAISAAHAAHSLLIVVSNKMSAQADHEERDHRSRLVHLVGALDAAKYLLALSNLAGSVAIREARDER